MKDRGVSWHADISYKLNQNLTRLFFGWSLGSKRGPPRGLQTYCLVRGHCVKRHFSHAGLLGGGLPSQILPVQDAGQSASAQVEACFFFQVGFDINVLVESLFWDLTPPGIPTN